MSLLAPALLLGLLGLAIPVLAHLLNRQPPRTLEFPAIRFLAADEPLVTRQRALQDPWLLFVRLLILALAVLVLARPTSVDPGGVAIVGEPHDAVVLVDASASMGLLVYDEPLVRHGVERAQGILDALPSGSRVGLITSDPGGPVLQPSAAADPVGTALADWIEAGDPPPGAWTLGQTLPGAAVLLGDRVDDRKRVVYAISDGTAGGLPSLPKLAADDITLVPVPAVAPDQWRPGHVGIAQVTWEPAVEVNPRAIRVRADIRRYPSSDRREGDQQLTVPVTLSIDGVEMARGTVDLAAGTRAPLEFTHTLGDEESLAAATVAIDLPGDALPTDDRRYVWLGARDRIEVVVVNGDPSELRTHDEVFFLATAITASAEGERLRVTSLAPDQLELRLREQGAAALEHVDVLVLANVRAPAEAAAEALLERVRQGMGLWITMGDRVEPSTYNARLGPALPLALREAVLVGTAPGRSEAVSQSLAPANMSHPMFHNASGDINLSTATVRKLVLCEPDLQRDGAVAMTYTNGAPALVTGSLERGKVAVLTTSIDRDWTDLPLRPGFVPLASAVLKYLADADGELTGTEGLIGHARTFRAEGPVSVTLPRGEVVTLEPDDEGVATLENTFAPGHYLARKGEETVPFAVNVDSRESDSEWGAWTPSETTSSPSWAPVPIPRWRGLVVLLGLLLALESVLRWRRRGRG